jgi:hypothetical protein
LPTFVNLLSPRLSALPGRLVGFILAAAVVFLVAVALSPETRGRLDSAQDDAEVGAARRPADIPS